MQTEEIKPFDDSEVHVTHELCVRSGFDKLPGHPFKITSEILTPPGVKLDPSVIATMLAGAINIWCHRILETDPALAREEAQKILPLAQEILNVLKMINPDTEVKNLISQLQLHKNIDEILKSNAGNNTHTKSDDRAASGGVQKPPFPTEFKRPTALGDKEQMDGGIQAGSLGSSPAEARRSVGITEDKSGETSS